MEIHMRTVLVVEDEPLIRMLLIDTLAEAGYAVLEAGTVLEAVAILGRTQIDAVITDIDMPGGLTGLDLASLLQSYGQCIPTIVTSGGRHLDDVTLPGRARFICKPYDQATMLSFLNEAIGASLVLQPLHPISQAS